MCYLVIFCIYFVFIWFINSSIHFCFIFLAFLLIIFKTRSVCYITWRYSKYFDYFIKYLYLEQNYINSISICFYFVYVRWDAYFTSRSLLSYFCLDNVFWIYKLHINCSYVFRTRFYNHSLNKIEQVLAMSLKLSINIFDNVKYSCCELYIIFTLTCSIQ